MLHSNIRFLAFVTILAWSSTAAAVPVEWTLNNWDLTGGDTVTGSFIYDADTLTFSNVNVFSDLDSTLFAFAGVNADANTLEFVTGDPSSVDLTDKWVMLGSLGNPGMTNVEETLFILTQGGTNPASSQSLCGNANCSLSSSPAQLLTSGSISGTVVPEPSTSLLLALGLGGLGVTGRRKRNCASAFQPPLAGR
jgi:hypothetical protein